MSDPQWNYRDDPEFLKWLKEQEGFAELFVEPAPEPKGKTAPTSGGGQQVPVAKQEESMSDLVGALAKGLMEGAKSTGDKPNQPVATAPPPKKVKHSWLIGDYEDDE